MKFNCPVCKQILEAEDEMINQEATCPNCGEKIIIKPNKRKCKNIKSIINYCICFTFLFLFILYIMPPKYSYVTKKIYLTSDKIEKLNLEILELATQYSKLSDAAKIKFSTDYSHRLQIFECKLASANKVVEIEKINKILNEYKNYELVSTITEIETDFPNFGKSDVHVGIKSAIKQSAIILILRKRVYF